MFVPAKCPSCGGALQVPDTEKQIRCMYCGIEIIVKNILPQDTSSAKFKNIINLANNAFVGRNMHEAYKYYSEALAIDSSSIDAWLGRATSVVWTSTIAQPRIAEGIQDINSAIKLGPTNEQLKTFSTQFYEACANVFLGFDKYLKSSDTQRPESWCTYAIGTNWSTQGMLRAYELSDGNQEIHKTAIISTSAGIMWLKQSVRILSGVPISITERSRIDTARMELDSTFAKLDDLAKQVDPLYKTPSTEIKTPAGTGCLVFLLVVSAIFKIATLAAIHPLVHLLILYGHFR